MPDLRQALLDQPTPQKAHGHGPRRQGLRRESMSSLPRRGPHKRLILVPKNSARNAANISASTATSGTTRPRRTRRRARNRSCAPTPVAQTASTNRPTSSRTSRRTTVGGSQPPEADQRRGVETDSKVSCSSSSSLIRSVPLRVPESEMRRQADRGPPVRNVERTPAAQQGRTPADVPVPGMQRPSVYEQARVAEPLGVARAARRHLCGGGSPARSGLWWRRRGEEETREGSHG